MSDEETVEHLRSSIESWFGALKRDTATLARKAESQQNMRLVLLRVSSALRESLIYTHQCAHAAYWELGPAEALIEAGRLKDVAARHEALIAELNKLLEEP